MLKMRTKLVKPEMGLPKYETKGSVGLDLYAGRQTECEPKSFTLIPANIIAEVPDGHMMVLVGRSSTSRKHNLIVMTGIIDQDYCGEEDQIMIQAYNPTDEAIHVKKGQRIAQALIVKISKVELEEVDAMTEDSRGGFGSTG
jgi:dUTP pyrophosphatase